MVQIRYLPARGSVTCQPNAQGMTTGVVFEAEGEGCGCIRSTDRVSPETKRT
jgi:hypothetical protein